MHNRTLLQTLAVTAACGALALALLFAGSADAPAPVTTVADDTGATLMTTPGVPGVRTLRRPAFSDDPIKPREDWFYYQRAYPLDDIADGARRRALQQAKRVRVHEPLQLKATATSMWTQVGPVGFDSNIEPTWGRMSGRVRSLAIDPTDTSRLFLGVATGGVWRSTDGGTTWAPISDNEASLAIGSVAIDPQNVNTVYAGTGEGNGSYYSAGILKTTNADAATPTWTTLGATTFARGQIVKILISPTDSDLLVVCAKNGNLLGPSGGVGNSVGGIYRSTDGGATWTNTASNFCRELVRDPSDFSTMYHSAAGIGAGNGLYKSTDAGVTWTGPIATAPNGASVGRLAIGISSSGTTIYIGGSPGGAVTLQKSTDSGATFTALTPGLAKAAAYCESQCGYDNVITVNPTNADDVFFGGVGSYRTTDGGTTFTIVGENNDGGGPLHVDHHVLVFDPTSASTIYSGNDGGLYKSTDGGATWTALGATLATIQTYHLALHPTNADIMFTGNQDNGTTRRVDSNLWTERNGGDGGYAGVDQSDPTIVYASTTELQLNKSTDSGDTFTPLTTPAQSRTGFISPFIIDPTDSNILYGGSFQILKSTDKGDNWTETGGDLTGGDPAVIVHIAVARSNNQVVYAVTSDGKVQRSADGAGSFTDTTKAPLPGRYATNVAVHPTDENTAYVTFSGFNDATPGTPGHVFKTTDGGTTWTDVTGTIPDAPANAVAIRPDNGAEIYVGTDVGVYISLDSGATWARMGTGIPNVPISVLAVNGTTDRLCAGTYGRSVYCASISGAAGPFFTDGFESGNTSVWQFTDP